ncbi:hypothetical protein ULMA_21090 [Patiriisocius marinus]|uniref:Curli production assembly/transport component CsgE n=1 Tax=Patiriisocius marinus TaxID=1397112 RepID=A0A5J4J2J3_9FLAO|nr:hypothetical protein ULMA_21090 [Patiriisocius marinus]
MDNNRIRKYILNFIFTLFSISTTFAQFYNKEVKASIKVEKSSEFYTFKAISENLTPSDYNLRYEFMVFKTDENNNSSKSSQENRFFIKANEKQLLSSVTINYNVTGKIVIALLIYDENDKPIGQDRIELSEGGQTQLEDYPEKAEAVTRDQAAPQDGFVKRGLVLKKTLTKTGSDFYRFFYEKCYNLGLKTPHDILITESFARGRTTRIEVLVENKLVWQFFSQPKKDFLKQMAETAFERSIAQLRILQKQDKQLTQY